jgi:hypothetical protein
VRADGSAEESVAQELECSQLGQHEGPEGAMVTETPGLGDYSGEAEAGSELAHCIHLKHFL